MSEEMNKEAEVQEEVVDIPVTDGSEEEAADTAQTAEEETSEEQAQTEETEMCIRDSHNTLWGTGVCGCIGKCQLYRENHAGENGDHSCQYSAEHVKGNYCFDNAAMGFSCVAQ